jgi:uncharacterized repeat protein (TIGR01451 family)
MRTTTLQTSGAVRRSRLGARLAIAGLVAVLAALALPGIASAATHTGKVSGIGVSPSLSGHGGFGLYHFNIAPAHTGDVFSYPFVTGDKIGHCVEATVGAGNNTSTLRTEGDLSLDNSDVANTIGAGFTTGAQRIEWILLSSYKNSPGDSTGVQGAAHQSAIWQLTNPSSGNSIKIGGGSANEVAAAGRATQLLADSATNYASVKNAAALSIVGGADLQTCANTARSVTVTGSPWTDATLSLSGPGVFHTSGTATTTVNLGATGSATVQVDSTGAGAVNVTASIKVATMVQADNGGNQDFVYLEFMPTSKTVTITFKYCKDLTIAKTAVPTFDRAFTWTIAKSVSGPDTQTANAGTTVGFDYNVVATKSTPVDTNWKVSGTITVTNPNTYAVSGATVTDTPPAGAVCVLQDNGAVGSLSASGSKVLTYTCTFAAKPSYNPLSNHATVTWQKDGVTGTSSAGADAVFQFGTGSAGNPSATHDSITVSDAFNGGAPVVLGTTSATITYKVHKDIVVPTGVSGCIDVDNTATFTTQNPNNTPGNSSSVTTHVCVTGHDLTIAKTVNPSYTRTYTWTIDKKVNGADSAGPISTTNPTVPAHYTVVTTKTGANHGFKLAGTITVTNPNSFAVSGATVADQAPAGFTCTVQNGGAVGALAANGSATLSYSCTYSGQTAPTTGANHATVSWTPAAIPNDPSGNTSASASASYDFATATVTIEHNAVDILDTNVAHPLATNVTAGDTYTYDLNIPTPTFGCTTTPNTAKVTDTGQPGSVLGQDTATIQVCRTQQGLAISKTADPAYTRSFDWTIAKSVDQTSVTTSSDSAVFNYTVVVTKSAATDSGWTVTGAISVTNPNAYTVNNVTVTEQGVNNGGTCVLNTSGAIGTMTQGQTASVGYTCTYAQAPSPAAGTNTANVTWTLPASGDQAATPQSGSVTQAFAFGDPTTIVHDTVNVNDVFNGATPATLDGGANLNASKTFTYSRSVAVPASGCLTYNNTATVTATDTGLSKDSSASVQACRQVPPTPPVTPVSPAVVKSSVPPSNTTMTLVKHASSPTVKAGGTVNFTIRWKNTGKIAAKNVVICDDLPNQMTFVSAKGSTFKNGKACWSRKSVAKGATLIFRVVARVDANVANVKLVNVATATASNAKPKKATAPVRALRNARTRAGGVTG